MKTGLTFMGLLAVLLGLSPAWAVTTDAPHNAAISMSCVDCHTQTPPPAGSYTDAVCLSCHTNATGGGYSKNSAPLMRSHASASTGDKYGTWSVTCIACHDKHIQGQQAAYGPAAYLATGTISSVTDNGNGTTTFGYMNLAANIAGWDDYTKWGRKSPGNASGGNERGLILYPNTADLTVSFEVLFATAIEVTVTGSIDGAFPGTVVPGGSFALSYGQFINASVVGAGGTSRSVRFFQNSNAQSFAFNEASTGSTDPSPDGICQPCHTMTSFWRADGTAADHYSGENCTLCHKHEEGFKASCDVCHNAPPVTGKHTAHFGEVVPYYDSTAIQSTPTQYGFGCGICHQATHLNTTANPRTVEVNFAGVATQDSAGAAGYAPGAFSVYDPGTGYTFNYSDGTCSNTYCHGNYPGSGLNASVAFSSGTAVCGSCHGASNTASPNSGSHLKHADTLGHRYACTLCHYGIVSGAGPEGYVISDKSRHVSGFVDWEFNTTDPRVSTSSSYSTPSRTTTPSDGLTRSYGTCSNLYCHSIVQTPTGGPLTGAPGEYATTLSWGTYGGGSRYCGPCHKNGSHHDNGSPAPMDSGSHTAHLRYEFNTLPYAGKGSYKCAICHRYEQQSAGSYNSCDACHTTMALYANHVDGTVNVSIDTAFGSAAYNDTSATPGAPGNGFFSCSNSYCHSNGTSVSTSLIPANVSSVWGSGTLSCSGCHGNPPDYSNDSPKKNSHPAHASEKCSACHVTTTADGTTIASTATHVNKAYDVNADIAAGVAFTYTYAETGGSCATVSCHGGGSATWGGSLDCQSCHVGTADRDDFAGTFWDNGIAAGIKGAGEWDSSGHGRPMALGAYASGNPAAAFTISNACLYCHDDGVNHKEVANPFRLRSIDDATWGKNGVCQNCHAAGSAGITVDSVSKNGTKKIGSTHYGSKHAAAANGGQFCWDCHDSHGDTNIFMVHAAVARTTDTATGAPTASVTTSFVNYLTGTDYAKSAAPYDGVCNVCHTATEHYTATSGDGHNADTRCTTCHAHTRDDRNNAFQAACDACHGNPPIDNATLVNFTFPSGTGSTTAGAHTTHADTLSIGCESCHANSVGAGPLHSNGDLKVSLGFSLFDGAYLGGAYNGQSTVSYNASESNTLVSSGGLSECSNLYCHGATMAPNGGTDTTPVWNDPATAACGTCHGVSASSSPRRGAHYRHTAAYTDIGHEYPCTWCHQDPAQDPSLHVNNRSEVTFSTYPAVSGGTYTGTPAMLDPYGNCTNVYCHSNVQTSPPGGPLTYKTINWGSTYGGDFACNQCHEGPVDHYSVPLNGNTTGSHPKHASNRIYCSTCHANDLSQDPDPNSSGWGCFGCHTWNGPNVTHANYAVDVNIVTKFSGTYSGTPAPGDSYGSCSSTYCHGTGVSVRTGTVPENVTTAWGSGALACNACHGNAVYPSPNNAMPSYTNGTPKENSHASHVIVQGIQCQNCHNDTTKDGATIATPALHANTQYDAKAAGIFAGKTITFTYTPATTTSAGSCSSISCHGGNIATWGGTLKCSSCHYGAADVNDFAFGNGTFALISSSQWASTGHGRAAASGPYSQSGNPAANFDAAAGMGDACLYCHDDTIGHNAPENVFRLKGTTGPDGMNGNCQKCHKPGSTGYVSGIDGPLPSKDASEATKMADNHWLTSPTGKHSNSRNGGKFCWDCHDPHGDINVAMVQDAVSKRNDWNGTAGMGIPTVIATTSFMTMNTWESYVNSSGTGVCQVCHEVTMHFTGSTNYDTDHNPGVSCTICHTHRGSASVDGDAFPGGDCIGCHSQPQGNRVAVAGQFSINSHHIQGVELTVEHCYQCHWEANSDGSINSTFHGGSANPGSAVNLVIYGNGTRPTTYTEGTTAIEYTAGAEGGGGGGTVTGTVTVVDTWRQLATSGGGSSRTATFAAGTGTDGNRIVVIGMAWEDSHSNGCNPSSITGNYGGQTIVSINEANSSNNREGQWMGYVRETGIAARSNNTITLTFSGCTPDRSPTISAATYDGGDQTAAPSSVTASGTSGSSFSWSGLPVVNGGYAMYNISANGISSFTPPSTYTEQYDTSTSDFRMSGGDKAITADGTESRTVNGNTSSSRWALVAVSVRPASVSLPAAREIEKIDRHCLGCHSAQNNTIQPFGDGKTPKQYAWDGSSVAERYSQTGTTNWGKYSGDNTAPKVAAKAYSAHGNAAANSRGWDSRSATAGGTGVDGTLPDTSGNINVSCFDCHNSHGSTVSGTTTSYTSATTNGGILKDTTAGKGGYTVTYKPVPEGSAADKNASNPGASLCIDCHMTQDAGTTPWGYQSTFGATQAVMGYWEKPYWFGAAGVNPAGPQMRYPYKNLIGSQGGHFGASSSLATQVMGTIGGLCTPCHDPHGVSPTLSANQQYAVPLLKGTWMTSPYKEDAAPLATNEDRGTTDENGRRVAFSGASTPGYHIDQNTFDAGTTTSTRIGPMITWDFNSTKRVSETAEQFGGLCLTCHPKASLSPTTGGSWKSVDRVHNTVKGWGGSGANANNAVHSYTCSKCHTPHNSCLPRLVVTNCLDFNHRGQVGSGGTASDASVRGEEGSGDGRFPAGGGGRGDKQRYSYFFGTTSGTRACHDNTNTSSWPNNQYWNVKSPW